MFIEKVLIEQRYNKEKRPLIFETVISLNLAAGIKTAFIERYVHTLYLQRADIIFTCFFKIILHASALESGIVYTVCINSLLTR